MTADRQWLLIYLAIAAIFASLFIVYPLPPFQDYPNHLLESRVIAYPQRFAPNFQVQIKAVPNVASQLVLAAASKFIDLNDAGRIFYILYTLTFGLGAFLFSQRYFRGNYWAGLAFFPFLVNFFFWRGYMNFTMSVALLLLIIALDGRTKGAFGVILTLFFALILYFTHFFAAGVFILHRICRDLHGRELRAGTIVSAAAIASLVSFFVLGSNGELGEWKYGGIFWKFASPKRVLCIPYLALLSNRLVFEMINLYNCFVYIGAASAMILLAIQARACYSGNAPAARFISIGLVLAIGYLSAPSVIGKLEVDNRISFFFFLLLLPWAAHIASTHVRARAVMRFVLVGFVYVSFLIYAGQFDHAQPRLKELYEMGMEQKVPRIEPVRIDQRFRVQDLAKSSRLHRLLESVKLHTDLSQLVLCEEHVDSWFYMAGGFPRRVFTTSIVKANFKTVP